MATFLVPAWFQHLAKDVIVHVTPFKHFGSAWGELLDDGLSIQMHATTRGQWNVLITASRKDAFTSCCPQEIECRGMRLVAPRLESPPKGNALQGSEANSPVSAG